MGIFNYAAPNLVPIPIAQIFADYGAFGSSNYRVFHRCPGGATQPIAGSNPFLDGGMLTAGPPFPPGLATVTPATCSRAHETDRAHLRWSAAGGDVLIAIP